MLVLKYGSPESLEIIKAHGRELAAVLVEPVQILKISVPLIEVTGKTGVTEWFLKEGEIPFNLAAPPLFR